MADKMADCKGASIRIDGRELLAKAQTYLTVKLPQDEPRPLGCEETVTHLFAGDSVVCEAQANALIGQFYNENGHKGTLDVSSCGRSGLDVKLIVCDQRGPVSSIVYPALASSADSARNSDGVLEVETVLLTSLRDYRLWDREFRDSFEAECQSVTVADASNRRVENSRLVNASIFIDGRLLPEKGHALLAKELPLDSTQRVGDCREEVTHVFAGDFSACIFEANRVKVASKGVLNDPSCGESGRDVRLVICRDKETSVEREYAAVASHFLSKPDEEGTLVIEALLLTTESDSNHWTDEFKLSFQFNCKQSQQESNRSSE